eukprot:14903432-Alexandrium_andersonii.AAC.1
MPTASLEPLPLRTAMPQTNTAKTNRECSAVAQRLREEAANGGQSDRRLSRPRLPSAAAVCARNRMRRRRSQKSRLFGHRPTAEANAPTAVNGKQLRVESLAS